MPEPKAAPGCVERVDCPRLSPRPPSPKAPPPPREKAGSLPAWAAIGLLLAAAIVPYARTLGFGFVLDDERLLRSLPEIRTLGSIPDVLGLTGRVPQPRALRTVSYSIDHALAGGFDPAVFHATNLLLHALAVLAVWRLVAALARPRAALFAALLFAVHPVQTETVAFVTARKDLLAGLFSALAFAVFLAHRKAPSAGRYVAILALFALAVLGKEVAVVLPALFLAHDAIVSGEGPARALRRRFAFYAPFTALALLGAGVAIALHRISSFAADARFPGDSALETGLTVPAILARYASLLLLPVGQSADYSFDAFPLVRSPLDPRFLVPLLFLAAIGYAAVRLRRRSPVAAFGLAWTAIALLPVAQIVPHHEILAEHYLYLPAIGFAIAAGTGLDALASRHPATGPRLAATIVLLLAALGALRVRVWSDAETLLASVAERYPRCARARFGLGEERLRRGRDAEAEAEWAAAAAVGPGRTPEESRGYVAAQNRLAIASASRWTANGRKPGDPDLERAVERLLAARDAAPDEPGPRQNLLALAVQAARPDLAMQAIGPDAGSAGAALRERAGEAILEIGALPGDRGGAAAAMAIVGGFLREKGRLSGEKRQTALRIAESWLESRGDLPGLIAYSRWRGLSVKETQRRVRRRNPVVPSHLPPSVEALRRLPEIERGDPRAADAPPADGPALEALATYLSKSLLEAVRRGPRDKNPEAVREAAEDVRRALRAFLGDPVAGDRDI